MDGARVLVEFIAVEMEVFFHAGDVGVVDVLLVKVFNYYSLGQSSTFKSFPKRGYMAYSPWEIHPNVNRNISSRRTRALSSDERALFESPCEVCLWIKRLKDAITVCFLLSRRRYSEQYSYLLPGRQYHGRHSPRQ